MVNGPGSPQDPSRSALVPASGAPPLVPPAHPGRGVVPAAAAEPSNPLMTTAFAAMEREIEQSPRHGQVLSFEQYLKELSSEPYRHTRGSAWYFADAIRHWGVVRDSQGTEHFGISGFPWQPPELKQPSVVLGQDAVFGDLEQKLRRIGGQPHAERGIFLVAPTGSGKSLIIRCLLEGLEAYSKTAEGTLWALGWDLNALGGKLGFNRSSALVSHGAVVGDLFRPHQRSHPWAVLSPGVRAAVLKGISSAAQGAINTDYVLRTELDPASSVIIEHLHAQARGDPRELVSLLQACAKAYRAPFNSSVGWGIVNLGAATDPFSDDIARKQYAPEEAPDQRVEGSAPFLNPRSAAIYAHRGVLHLADYFHQDSQGDWQRFLLSLTADGVAGIRTAAGQVTVRPDTVVILDATPEMVLSAAGKAGAAEFFGRFATVAVGSPTDLGGERAILQRRLRAAGQESALGPHALDTLSLFVLATRVIRARAEHFEDLPRLRDLLRRAELSVAQKALLLAEDRALFRAEDFVAAGEARAKSRPYLSGDDVAYFASSEARKRIREEYPRPTEVRMFAAFDGVPGLSPRDSQVLIDDLLAKKRAGPLTVVAVLRYLDEQIKVGWHLDPKRGRQFQTLLDQRVEARMRVQGGRTVEDLNKDELRKLQTAALDEIKKEFPLQEFSEILADVTAVARARVKDDVVRALGAPDPVKIRREIMRYVMHVRTFIMPQVVPEVPPEYRQSRMSTADADETVMRDFEKQIEEHGEFQIPQGGLFAPSVAEERRGAQAADALRDTLRKWVMAQFNKVGVVNGLSAFEERICEVFPQFEAAVAAKLGFSADMVTKIVHANHEHGKAWEKLLGESLPKSDAQNELRDRWLACAQALHAKGYPIGSIAHHIEWAFTEKG